MIENMETCNILVLSYNTACQGHHNTSTCLVVWEFLTWFRCCKKSSKYNRCYLRYRFCYVIRRSNPFYPPRPKANTAQLHFRPPPWPSWLSPSLAHISWPLSPIITKKPSIQMLLSKSMDGLETSNNPMVSCHPASNTRAFIGLRSGRRTGALTGDRPAMGEAVAVAVVVTGEAARWGEVARSTTREEPQGEATTGHVPKILNEKKDYFTWNFQIHHKKCCGKVFFLGGEGEFCWFGTLEFHFFGASFCLELEHKIDEKSWKYGCFFL